MRAASFSHTGPAREVLRVGEMPDPQPGPGEVRVRIATSGPNPSDVKRRGAAPAGKPAEYPVVIPHSDGAGTIDAVGEGVPASRIGERVWTINAQYRRPFGTAAEYCVLPSAFAPQLPDNTGFDVGACLGIPALTACHAIHVDGLLHGQTLLIQGGAGDVAFYAIQFAKRAGATVITTISSPEKAERARSAGADHTIDYKREDVKARIDELTGGKRVDRIIEVDLKANAMTYPDILKDHGTVVVYGSGAGPVQLPVLVPLSTTLQFILVYTLTDAERTRYIGELNALLAQNALKHAIGPRFPLERIAEAHEAVEQGALGNVIVEVAS